MIFLTIIILCIACGAVNKNNGNKKYEVIVYCSDGDERFKITGYPHFHMCQASIPVYIVLVDSEPYLFNGIEIISNDGYRYVPDQIVEGIVKKYFKAIVLNKEIAQKWEYEYKHPTIIYSN